MAKPRTPKKDALCRTPAPKLENPNKRGAKKAPTGVVPWLEPLADEDLSSFTDDHDSQIERTKRHLGRPVRYRPEYCALLVDHLSRGNTFESFGSRVGCDRSTVYEWLKKPEFSDARKRGEPLQERSITELLRQIGRGRLTRTYEKTFMVDGLPIVQEVTEPTTGNASAAMYLAKNILGWKDKHDVTLSGNPDAPLVGRQESREEKLERLERLRKAREAVDESA